MEGLGIAKRNLVEKIVLENWKVTPQSKMFNFKEVLYIIQEMLDQEGTKYLQDGQPETRKHSIFKQFVELMLYRNVANYDSMVLLTSAKGGGKSSAAIMMAKYHCKLLGIRFDPTRHMAYNNADVMNKIDTLNKFEPLVCDEAVRFACVTGDTIIKTQYGDKKITDCIGLTNFGVYGYNDDTNKEELQIAEKCIATKIDEVYEVRIEGGRIIKCTKEHKFLTLYGWKQLQELKEGDEIVGI
jgi:hypothetical protein